VAGGFSSPFLIKMATDVRSTLMMCLRVRAGHEILRHFQCLTPLVKDRGELGDSLANSGGLEKDLEFGVVSYNFHVFDGLSCILMGCFVLFINTSSYFTKQSSD
jgi:hypothetical protein